MLKKLIALAFILSLNGQTICLNMIVKDERAVIERCLNSVKGIIDYWVIVDTGSTDGTQEIIRKCMKGIPGELHQSTWVDFSHNRNEALKLAKGKGDYLLFLDADEQLAFAPGFHKPFLDKDFYLLTCDNQGVKYGRKQMVNNHLKWEWQGAVHECIESLDAGTRTFDLVPGVVNLISWDGSRSKDPKKYQKDAAVLEKALLKDPTNKRNQFYLAKSYQDARMPREALKNYEKRIAMGDWDPEVEWSLFQIGILQEELNMPSNTIIDSYSRAYQASLTRAEPLYRLACFYNKQRKYLLGYWVLKHALMIPCPASAMYLENWIYDFGLLSELSAAAFYLGKYDEAREACVEILRKPNLPPEMRKITESNLFKLNFTN
jgi:glycosyltransferase involved in cell wall biosynthesis